MNHWQGTILHIDLEEPTYWLEQPPAEVFYTWIGGKGLAGYYLRPVVTRSWDDAEMPILIMAGPLVGTAAPTSGRICMMSRSPLTGAIGDCSVGGSFGTELRKAGLEGIVITGRSPDLVGIEINDQSITFTDARRFVKMEISPLYTQLKARGAVAAIGPAAENGVLFATVMIDGHFAAGRTGLGRVFATKNLKYLTVKGSGRIPVHNRENLLKARTDIFRQVAASPVLMGEHGITNYGTGALYDLMHSRRMMPTANFRSTRFEAAPALNASIFKQHYAPKRAGCKGCHIRCKKVAPNGSHLPEFETMSHFSALLENDDLETITQANKICNETGIDTISAGGTLACYAEINGLKLQPAQILNLLHAIGRGEGVGAELGQGSYRYATAKGRPELSFSVKKLELPAYDPRGAYGMALAYVTSTRGGCHLRAYPISHEILRKPVATDRFSFEGKARIIKIAEDLNAVVDSLTACKFVFFASTLEEYAKAFTAVTGIDMTAQDLLKVGERIYYHERVMNTLNGFSSKDDDLPARFFQDNGTSGSGIEIKPLDRQAFLQVRANYYQIRGLDPKGKPTPEKVRELGLPDFPEEQLIFIKV